MAVTGMSAGVVMTDLTTEQDAVVEPAGAGAIIKIDDPAYNPFWPKNMSGPSAPDTPGTNHVDIDSITFGSPSTNVTINIHTTPVNTAWSVDWGDGTAVDSVTAGTNT